MKTTRPAAATMLIYLLALLALGGLVTGPLLMLQPDGSLIQMPLSVMQGSPFPNFFVPGLIMFVFLGIYPLGIAYGVWKKPGWRWPDAVNSWRQFHWSWAGSLAAGVIVIIWLSVELLWVGYSILHTIYYVWAGLIIALALFPVVRKYLAR